MQFVGSSVVAVGAASAQSAAVPAHIHTVMLTASTDCWVSYGVSPTASAADGSFFMPAGEAIKLGVVPGQLFAAIQDAAAGELSVAFLS